MTTVFCDNDSCSWQRLLATAVLSVVCAGTCLEVPKYLGTDLLILLFLGFHQCMSGMSCAEPLYLSLSVFSSLDSKESV